MLVDDITFILKAGDGGRGAVAFNKIKLNRGPTGGDGGRGGSIYFEGVPSINALLQYARSKEIVAESGRDGRGQFLDGRGGEDRVLQIPIGTEIVNVETGFRREMMYVGEKILAAGGGVGGRGNFKFKSSVNVTPMEFEPGTNGDNITYRLELKMIADIGLVGMPNAGKSSLLNAITGAHSKVGSYQFTTLEPHLGAYHNLVLADVPGLIEGASNGKGLGDKFLRHVERTRVLFHLVSCESEDVTKDYFAIRNELGAYNKKLLSKQEYVFLTKCDEMDDKDIESKLKSLQKAGIKAIAISILDELSMAKVRDILNALQ